MSFHFNYFSSIKNNLHFSACKVNTTKYQWKHRYRTNLSGDAKKLVIPVTSKLQADLDYFILQLDGAPSHWHLMVRSPDLTVCEFFFVGSKRSCISSTDIDDFKHRITTAINSVNRDVLLREYTLVKH